MRDFRKVFPKRNTFLVVIHVEDEAQALRNVRIAVGNGADGVFLINHSVPVEKLLATYAAVRREYPLAWIGVNFLDLSLMNSLEAVPMGSNGLWSDSVDYHEGEADPTLAVRTFHKWRGIRTNWEGLHFGGVAFKYQRQVLDVAKAAQSVAPYVDVITTSGMATGEAPPVEKIAIMREAIGTHPLAIASGMTPENVGAFIELVDCFMVATGVSDSHTELNAARVRAFATMLAD